MRAATSSPEGRASARPNDALSAPIQESRTRRSASLRENEERRHPNRFSPLEAHNRAVIIYVTICTAKRRAILASPSVHEAVVKAWLQASTWLVGRYVVLPDHAHFFCAPNGIDAPSLERWMRFWKSRAIVGIRKHKGEVWQRDHWDRQLRRGESYDEKWEYVRKQSGSPRIGEERRGLALSGRAQRVAMVILSSEGRVSARLNFFQSGQRKTRDAQKHVPPR